MVSSEPRASGASQHVLKEPKTKGSRSEMRDTSSTSNELCAKTALVARPRDDVAGATGHTGSKLSETALLNDDNGTGSIGRVDNGMGSRWSPVG